jgi:hypothetical protein
MSVVFAQEPVVEAGRKPLRDLEPYFRAAVMNGWIYFQTSFAEDGMACANCHLSHNDITRWLGAYPKIQPFDGDPYAVKTLRQVVLETLSRHTDLVGNGIVNKADSIVAYISWWGDGKPVMPGDSEGRSPPSADALKLKRAVMQGQEIFHGSRGASCGRCHGDVHTTALDEKRLAVSFTCFPRFDQYSGRVLSFDSFLMEHGKSKGFWLGSHEQVSISAYLASISKGEPLKPGTFPTPGMVEVANQEMQ